MVPKKSHFVLTLLYLINKPGATQTEIMVGQLVEPGSKKIALELLTQIFGRGMESRVQEMTRNQKGSSYGGYSEWIPNPTGPDLLYVEVPVQTNATKQTLEDLQKGLEDFFNGGNKPPTQQELERAQALLGRRIGTRWETRQGLGESVGQLIRRKEFLNYWGAYPELVQGTTLEKLRESTQLIDPNNLVWIVVGDLSVVETPIRELNLGAVEVVQP